VTCNGTSMPIVLLPDTSGNRADAVLHHPSTKRLIRHCRCIDGQALPQQQSSPHLCDGGNRLEDQLYKVKGLTQDFL
jgi:hypothetical protein